MICMCKTVSGLHLRSGLSLKAAKSKCLYPQKNLRFYERKYLWFETITEGTKLLTQREHPDTYLWYISTTGKVYTL